MTTRCDNHHYNYESTPSPALKKHNTTLPVMGLIAGLILASMTASPAVAHAINPMLLQAIGLGLAIPSLIGLVLFIHHNRKVEREEFENSPLIKPFVDEWRQGHLELMEKIKKAIENHSINAPQDTVSKATLLHEAVKLKDEEAIELILENNGDLNMVDNQGRTPLHWAAFYAHNLSKSWAYQRLLNHPDQQIVQDNHNEIPEQLCGRFLQEAEAKLYQNISEALHEDPSRVANTLKGKAFYRCGKWS